MVEVARDDGDGDGYAAADVEAAVEGQSTRRARGLGRALGCRPGGPVGRVGFVAGVGAIVSVVDVGDDVGACTDAGVDVDAVQVDVVDAGDVEIDRAADRAAIVAGEGGRHRGEAAARAERDLVGEHACGRIAVRDVAGAAGERVGAVDDERVGRVRRGRGGVGVLGDRRRRDLDGPLAGCRVGQEHTLDGIDGVGCAAGRRDVARDQAVVAPVGRGAARCDDAQGQVVDAVDRGGDGALRIEVGHADFEGGFARGDLDVVGVGLALLDRLILGDDEHLVAAVVHRTQVGVAPALMGTCARRADGIRRRAGDLQRLERLGVGAILET